MEHCLSWILLRCWWWRGWSRHNNRSLNWVWTLFWKIQWRPLCLIVLLRAWLRRWRTWQDDRSGHGVRTLLSKSPVSSLWNSLVWWSNRDRSIWLRHAVFLNVRNKFILHFVVSFALAEKLILLIVQNIVASLSKSDCFVSDFCLLHCLSLGDELMSESDCRRGPN